MGLSGPKKRTKIAHDPNNNNWAKATDSFGHKILASQGWKPGDTLGARDANHASHYTAGSNSHIRVLLKDDNLGLGAARGGNNADTFGLSLYSGLLGRLNGKTEAQVEKEQSTQRDVELAVYQGRKYGHINFVSAGFLVGDKIELKSTVMPSSKAKQDNTTTSDTTSANKKRKRSEADEAAAKDSSSESSSSDSSDDEQAQPAKKSKKAKDSKKKSKKSSIKESGSDSTDELKSKDKKRKKEKKEKKRKLSESSSSKDESRAERKARKAERRAKKEEKRKRKAEKKAKKSASASVTPSSTPGTPAEPAQPAVAALYGRQNVRQRYIAQKRLALMNPDALKEIFMVKA